MVKLILDTSHAEAELAQLVNRKLRASASFLEDEIRDRISTTQPVRRTASGKLVGLNPSKPGKPPHVLTGELREKLRTHVVQQLLQSVAYVGSSAPHARMLELGTSRMAPRPYMRSTLTERWRQMLKVFKRS